MALKTQSGKQEVGAKQEAKNPERGPAARDTTSKRKIKYPHLTVCGIKIPEEALMKTAEDAKAFLGWESESEHAHRETKDLSPEQASKKNVTFGEEYECKDYYGEKIRLSNNVRNRPLQEPWVEQLAQEFLNKRWQMNGEAAIFGETGLALSFQHRGLALIRAQQILDYDPEKDKEKDETEKEKKLEAAKHWRKVWGKDHVLRIPIIDVCGIKETPDVTRTLDNVRPRTLSDVLFADTGLFKNTPKKDREAKCRITDWAIRTVWARTGMSEDAFSPRRTHSESLEFLTNHPRILKAVDVIWEEIQRRSDEDKKKVSVLEKYISPGTAAGLLFLMGASASDRVKYDNARNPNDNHLDFSNWDKAVTFFQALGDATQTDLSMARQAIEESGNKLAGSLCPIPVRVGILVNAWEMYLHDDKPGSWRSLVPELKEPDTRGNRAIAVMPSVGGIDLGNPAAERLERERAERAAKKAAKDDAEALAQQVEDVDPEEVQEGAELEELDMTHTDPDEDQREEIEARKEVVKAQSLKEKKDGNGKGLKKNLRGGVN